MASKPLDAVQYAVRDAMLTAVEAFRTLSMNPSFFDFFDISE
jgi:hypothetical protein